MSGLDKYKSLRIAVGIPSNGMWYADFGVSLCNMLVAFSKYRIGEYKNQMVMTHHIKGSVLSRSRLLIVRGAQERKATHLLFIDTDQTFPRNIVHRLILHDKDIVGANVATKSIPASPTARRAPGPGEPSWGVPVFTDPESKGLEKVWRIGTGVLMVNMRVFEKTGVDIFTTRYKPDVDDYQGEDWSMCEAFERAGFDMWIDHDLSKEIGHIGNFTYTHSVVGEVVKEPILEVVND